MRGVKDKHTGITDARLLCRIRESLRKISSQTVRKQYINKVRFRARSPVTHNMKWHVKCELCGKVMPCDLKIRPTKVDGTPYKRPRRGFDVDHVVGNPPLTKLSELYEYVKSLFYGELRLLCFDCHKEHGVAKRELPKGEVE